MSTAPKRRSRSREGAYTFPKKTISYYVAFQAERNLFEPGIYSSSKKCWVFPCEITCLDGNFKQHILIFETILFILPI